MTDPDSRDDNLKAILESWGGRQYEARAGGTELLKKERETAICTSPMCQQSHAGKDAVIEELGLQMTRLLRDVERLLEYVRSSASAGCATAKALIDDIYR